MSPQAAPDQLRTERLLLRPWRDSDLEPFAAMNADPEVMEHFPSLQDRATSDASVDRFRQHWQEHGYGLWAVEVPGHAEFIGFVGLMQQTFDAHFTPAVEIGWRLDRASWGRGYAPEGAAATLDVAFGVLGLAEVVSMTSTGNLKSRRVMEKLRMRRDPSDDFDHPRIGSGSLRRHVLYRITSAEWAAGGEALEP